MMRAIEVTAVIDENLHLILDEPLPFALPARVRAILLIPDSPDFSEQEGLYAATHNPAFDFLREPAEDIYTFGNALDSRLQPNGIKLTSVCHRRSRL